MHTKPKMPRCVFNNTLFYNRGASDVGVGAGEGKGTGGKSI